MYFCCKLTEGLKALFLCCALLFPVALRAQVGSGGVAQKATGNVQEPVAGIVVDDKGEPLAGVSIQVVGHKGVGTATDLNGKFVLRNIPRDAKQILVTFLGMKSQTLNIVHKKNMKIVLQEDTHSLDNVVITGYQVIDKRYSTSATTSVKMEDIYVPGVADVSQMLEGKIPDMVVTTNSGEINSTPRLRIRGTSTLIGNREPLWVLDGIILTDPIDLSPDVLNDPDYVNRIGNAIAGINPQDILRIDVLKDAAATALYGTRAANGVIVVTTKSGREGRPIVSYSATGTYRRRPRYTDRKVNIMNSNERIQFSQYLTEQHYLYPVGMPLVGYEYALQQLYNKQITQEEFNSQVNQMAELNTDWFDILDHDSFSQDHSVNISGGSEKVRYYASVGYTDQDDVIKNTTNRRYTAMAKLNIKLTSKLDVEFNANGYVNERKYNQTSLNPTNYAYNTSRAIPAFNADGSYYMYKKYVHPEGYFNYNIMNELDNSYQKQSTTNVMLTGNVRYRPFDWLNFNLTVSANSSNSNIEGWWGEKSFHIAQLRRSDYGEDAPYSSLCPFGGELNTTNSRIKGYTTRLQMNVNKYFGEDDQHNINFALGTEANSSRSEGYARTDRGYFADRGKQFLISPSTNYTSYYEWLGGNVPSITDGRSNMLSAYATLTYSYKDLYTVNVNGRYDGSNKFGSRSNEKLLPIWSASGNARLMNIFNIDNDWLNDLTLKLSYGEQGNMLDGQMPVMVIKKGSYNGYYNEFVSTPVSFANPDLKWEKTRSANVGLETSMFNNRLQLGVEFFYKRTVDAFMDKTISDVNGYNSYVVNSGTIVNKGYNVTWSTTPVKLRNFYWMFSGNISKVINRVKTAPGQETYELEDFLNGTAVVKGYPVGTFWSYKFLGLSPVDGGPLFDDWEERQGELMHKSNYEVYTKVLVPTGKREHDITGSFNNTFTYKQWRLGVTMSYGVGADTRLFRMFDDRTRYSAEANMNRDFVHRWMAPGDENKTNIPAVIGAGNSSYYYYNNHYSNGRDGLAVIANSAWDMYDYSDLRVVSADYLKLQQLTLTYEFGKNILDNWKLTRLALTLSASNLYTFCDKRLRGQTPTQGGFTEIQLSERPQYTIGLNVQF